MIVSARPMMKPFRTGWLMKFARKPRRSSPAASAATPAVMARPAVNAAKRLSPDGMRSATVAAERTAVAAIGPITRCRELPSAA